MKQSMGQTLTQSVYLHWIQESVTTKGMAIRGGQSKGQAAL
ncbi:hypothetical protein [Herbaspirillum sp. VT-16-41]|nr:hypothetical protein [Herbaspirillum sp. VT-16-41]